MKITMQALKDLGFEIAISYPHDNFITQVWVKGKLKVDRSFNTAEEYKLESQEVVIGEEYFHLKSCNELVLLDKILNK